MQNSFSSFLTKFVSFLSYFYAFLQFLFLNLFLKNKINIFPKKYIMIENKWKKIFEVLSFPLSMPLLFDASLVPIGITVLANTFNSAFTLFFVFFWKMGVSALAASQLIGTIVQFFLFVGVNLRQKRRILPEFVGFWPLLKSVLFKDVLRFSFHNCLTVFKNSVWNFAEVFFHFFIKLLNILKKVLERKNNKDSFFLVWRVRSVGVHLCRG